MTTKLEKLMFSINLLDRVSGPAGRIQKTLGNVASSAQANFDKIAAGGVGVAAAGYTLKSLASPAHDFNMAFGEIRSLEVAEKSLDALSDSAVAFSIKYGESAREFVSSSYDIQSAINGLEGNELARFTNASNVLAKGTKSDAATITDYMGTMYGIFKSSADEMGRGEWVERLTGQTATAVKMFKTTGTEMAGAFSSLGAEATSAGIAQAEQMAVLGKLQSTMSGSEAGTKYKAFLTGVGAAQDKLGLKFTDTGGRMLGITAILEKLQGKFGRTLDVAESDALKKAFGSDEAVGMIKLLMADTAGLKSNIQELGNVKGMAQAEKMAGAMVDPFQRWSQGVTAVRIGLGQALLPVLTPAIEEMAEGAGAIYRWTQAFPGLTRWIGYGIVTVVGLTGAVAAFAAIGGVARLATLGYGNATKFAGIMTGIFSKESKLAAVATAGWNLVVGLASGGMTVLRWALIGARTGMLWLNAAMYANPIGFVVLGVAALTGAVAGIIYYWDDLKKAFLDSSWGQAVMGIVDKVIGSFSKLTGAWDWVQDKLSWVPGMGGRDPAADIPKTSPSLDAPRKAAAVPGGAGRSIAQAITHNTRSESSQSIHIGQITTTRPINAQEIGNQLLMGV